MRHIPMQAIENTTSCPSFQCHELAIPGCCTRSKNPFPGSRLYLCYEPALYRLDVIPLVGNVSCYRDGLRDENETLLVRDMEGMIGSIAQEAAKCLGVLVCVIALLELRPRQRMYLDVFGAPLGVEYATEKEAALLVRAQEAVRLLVLSSQGGAL